MSAKPYLELSSLRKAMEEASLLLMTGLVRGTIVSDMTSLEPLILRLIVTEERTPTAEMLATLDAPKFAFLWAFASAWTIYKQNPNRNPQAFVIEQRLIATKDYHISGMPSVPSTQSGITSATRRVSPNGNQMGSVVSQRMGQTEGKHKDIQKLSEANIRSGTPLANGHNAPACSQSVLAKQNPPPGGKGGADRRPEQPRNKSSTQNLDSRHENFVAFCDVNDDTDEYLPPEERTVAGKRKRKDPKQPQTSKKAREHNEAGTEIEVVDKPDNEGKSGDADDDTKKRLEAVPTGFVFVHPCDRCGTLKLVCRQQERPGRKGGSCFPCSRKKQRCTNKGSEIVLQEISPNEKIHADVKEVVGKAEKNDGEAKPHRPRPVKRKSKANTELAKPTDPPNGQMPKAGSEPIPIGNFDTSIPQTSDSQMERRRIVSEPILTAKSNPLPNPSGPSSSALPSPPLPGLDLRSSGEDILMGNTPQPGRISDAELQYATAKVIADLISQKPWKSIEERVETKLEEITTVLKDIRQALQLSSAPSLALAATINTTNPPVTETPSAVAPGSQISHNATTTTNIKEIPKGDQRSQAPRRGRSASVTSSTKPPTSRRGASVDATTRRLSPRSHIGSAPPIVPLPGQRLQADAAKLPTIDEDVTMDTQ